MSLPDFFFVVFLSFLSICLFVLSCLSLASFDNKESAVLVSQADDLPTFQSVAVLGFGLIAMGEDIGAEMALRLLDNLLQ